MVSFEIPEEKKKRVLILSDVKNEVKFIDRKSVV